MLIFSTFPKKRHVPVRGFTLVELLVATSVFVLVLTIASDSLFSAQVINSQLQKTQVILDGVNLTTEMMVRDIRYGSDFNCGTVGPARTVLRKGCPYGAGLPAGTVLVFKPAVPLQGTLNARYDRVAFYLQNNAIYKVEYPYGSVDRTYQITSNDVTITTMGFYSAGVNSMSGSIDVSSQTDSEQPLIAVMIAGQTKVGGKGAPVSFKMHTSAVSRFRDQ